MMPLPELPEVQTIVDDLNGAGLPGTRIRRARVMWARTVADGDVKDFCGQIRGRTIIGLTRRAKYLVFRLTQGLTLIVHLRMSGRFEWGATHETPGRHHHVVLELDDGRCLLYHDTRKFGRFYLTRTPEKRLGVLGPEPLDKGFSAKAFAGILSGRRRQIKPLLLDQRFIAGLGNIYADEALWRAFIHPMRSSHTLSEREIIVLHRAIRWVLRQGLKNGGTALGKGKGNFQSARSGRGGNAGRLSVFRRTGLPCLRCRRTIKKIVVGQRSTHLCSRCQFINIQQKD